MYDVLPGVRRIAMATITILVAIIQDLQRQFRFSTMVMIDVRSSVTPENDIMHVHEYSRYRLHV